jgi:hypothetical protein
MATQEVTVIEGTGEEEGLDTGFRVFIVELIASLVAGVQKGIIQSDRV